MIKAIKRLYRKVIEFSGEQRKIAAFAARTVPIGTGQARALDVGCGYGRNLRWLLDLGFDAIGVELNPAIVAANVANGLRCVTPEDLPRTERAFDLVLMSHVIEHLPPRDLLAFMDGYLDRLRIGGHLVIATPLLSPYFFYDFDHVRPYHPVGLDMVFGPDAAQVQYRGRNRLVLRDIWFRRSPFRWLFDRALYVRSPLTRLVQVSDFITALLFRLSFGLVGRTDGWVGLYEKLDPAAPPVERNPPHRDPSPAR
jgi:SAM-dependent methyltransferase